MEIKCQNENANGHNSYEGLMKTGHRPRQTIWKCCILSHDKAKKVQCPQRTQILWELPGPTGFTPCAPSIGWFQFVLF